MAPSPKSNDPEFEDMPQIKVQPRGSAAAGSAPVRGAPARRPLGGRSAAARGRGRGRGRGFPAALVRRGAPAALARALSRGDYDGNGVLTASEAWRYQEKARNGRGRQAERLRVEARPAGRALAGGSAASRLCRRRYDRTMQRADLWLAKAAPLARSWFSSRRLKIGDKRDIDDATIQACSTRASRWRPSTIVSRPRRPAGAASRQRGRCSFCGERRPLAARSPAGGGLQPRRAAFRCGWPFILTWRIPRARPVAESTGSPGSARPRQCTYDPFVIREWIGEPAFRHGVLAAYGQSHAELGDPQSGR